MTWDVASARLVKVGRGARTRADEVRLTVRCVTGRAALPLVVRRIDDLLELEAPGARTRAPLTGLAAPDLDRLVLSLARRALAVGHHPYADLYLE